MRVSDFDYPLPAERIAQQPVHPREASRLLVLGRESGDVAHRRFDDLPELLGAGDLLVLNDTRVVPARLVGRKPTGGRVEVLLVERMGGDERGPVWRCLVEASRPPRPGARLAVAEGFEVEVVARTSEGWEVRLLDTSGRPEERLEDVGRMPLPPYIRRADGDPLERLDRESYQTVYARSPGAIAAPTAGLHFSSGLLERLERCGVRLACLTLHVGPATFLPVRTEAVEDHRMLEEAFELSEATAEAVAASRRRGGRVVAVGTTVVRVLEAQATDDGLVRAGRGRCGLFIYPGFRFRVVDALVTNFHLPRSTLLMLVSAYAGRERVLEAYRQAVGQGYRFYSYGDAMLVAPPR